jgi:hypothetical protein
LRGLAVQGFGVKQMSESFMEEWKNGSERIHFAIGEMWWLKLKNEP